MQQCQQTLLGTMKNGTCPNQAEHQLQHKIQGVKTFGELPLQF